MQEKHLFEYAVIRIVPRVEREEFLNTGVILYCPTKKFLQATFTLKIERVRAFCEKTDIDEVFGHLKAYELIAVGDAHGGPIARLDMPSRFRWLTATRSTIVQSSKVHPGFCVDPFDTLQELHRKLVL